MQPPYAGQPMAHVHEHEPSRPITLLEVHQLICKVVASKDVIGIVVATVVMVAWQRAGRSHHQ